MWTVRSPQACDEARAEDSQTPVHPAIAGLQGGGNKVGGFWGEYSDDEAGTENWGTST